MASPCKVDLKYCRQLPKIELHAHINGSISPSTLQKLAVQKISSDKNVKETFSEIHKWRTSVEKRERQTLKGCFQTFKLIHRVVKDVEAVSMVTYDVIKEFASDGVKYLELRSTPRDDAENGLTKKLYIDAVMRGIELCEGEGIDIIVKFLPSIDRRMSIENAGEVVTLALEYHAATDNKCVGLDLSGDPTFGDVKALVPLLQRARNHGLKLAIHIAEHRGSNEESGILLGVPPDRIGHGTYLHSEVGGEQTLVDTVVGSKIPIEMCLTSNLIGGVVESPASHHLQYWRNKKHPSVICTDDKGVFSTSLSEEYFLAADTFHLSRHDVWDMSEGAIDCVFSGEDTKDLLRRTWAKEKIKMELEEDGMHTGDSP